MKKLENLDVVEPIEIYFENSLNLNCRNGLCQVTFKFTFYREPPALTNVPQRTQSLDLYELSFSIEPLKRKQLRLK
jgi:hypothetical protein